MCHTLHQHHGVAVAVTHAHNIFTRAVTHIPVIVLIFSQHTSRGGSKILYLEGVHHQEMTTTSFSFRLFVSTKYYFFYKAADHLRCAPPCTPPLDPPLKRLSSKYYALFIVNKEPGKFFGWR